MLRATLPNGMQLLIIENHAAPIAVVNTWFMVGARNELKADEGISHFLEHMLFDGSVGMPIEDINKHLAAKEKDLQAYEQRVTDLEVEALKAQMDAKELIDKYEAKMAKLKAAAEE